MIQVVSVDHDGTIFPTMERQHLWFGTWWNHPENKEIVQGKKFPYEKFPEFMEMYNEKINHPEEVQNVYDFLGLKCDMKDFSHPVWPAYKSYAIEHPSKPYPGMDKVIKTIHEKGSLSRKLNRNRSVQLVLNTSNSWMIAGSDLEKAGLLDYFSMHISKEVLASFIGIGDPNSIKKPSNLSMSYALSILNVPGETVYHIGDTLVDLACGRKIQRLGIGLEENVKTIGCTWGYAGGGNGKKKAREVLESGMEIPGQGTVHFDHLVDEPDQILKILENKF